MHTLVAASDLIKVVPGLMVWTIVAFLITLFVLKKYAFGPIQKTIDERRERIRRSIEEAADEPVADDRLGEREAKPHDPLQLASQLGLPGDGLDHRGEDGPDADSGPEGAEPHAEPETERLACLDDIP